LLSLLVPAFKAGLRDLLQYTLQRESLAAHLDSLSDGLRICDLDGNVLHQNPAFAAQLAGDHGTAEIEKAIEEVVQPLVMFSRERQGNPDALAGRRVSLEVHTHHASYEVRGSFLGRELLGAEASIAISIHRLAPNTSLSDRALHERYKLTNREIEITRRLAHGESTKEIAASCGISLHTARRHTEKIFMKLGVRTRSQIGPKLRAN
jgi:DNA-binding CsgD family transcriptional regulator